MSKSKMSVIHNPAAYRRRCEPRDMDTANEAVENFWVEFYELLNKHGISDVTAIAQVAVIIRPHDLIEGEPIDTFVSSCVHIGNEAHAVEMAAYLHAFFRAQTEARINTGKARAEKRGRGE